MAENKMFLPQAALFELWRSGLFFAHLPHIYGKLHQQVAHPT
jgi:hypothetical protein